MIWSLAKEQLRAQRRYVIAAGVLIAATVAIAVYGFFMATSLVNTNAAVNHLVGNDRYSQTNIEVPSFFSLEQLTDGIDEANADGRSVVASAELGATLPDGADIRAWIPIHTLYGDVDWSTVLVSGAAPRPGEIAVPAEWAERHSVAIGDSVTPDTVLLHDSLERYPLESDFVVSGLTRSPIDSLGVHVAVPSAFVSLADAESLQAEAMAVTNQNLEPLDGDPRPADLTLWVAGNGDWMWSDQVSPGSPFQFTSPSTAGRDFAMMAAVGVGALVIGTFAVAFALGRAQAQVRSRWVATARALGATRSHIVWATIVESLAIGVAAGVMGFATGAAAAAVHLRAATAGIAAPLIVTPNWINPLAVGGAILLGLVLAVIVGAVPAFWSARVQPATALKPVSDLSEAQVSRRVAVRPLALSWALALAYVTYAATAGVSGGMMLVVLVAALIVVVGGIMLAHEVLRWSLPRHARRLSRSRRISVMVAGDAILARPRQSTIPAFVEALATCALVTIYAPKVATDAWSVATWYTAGPEVANSIRFQSLSPFIFFAVFALVTLVSVAVSAASGTLTARDAAAREALGMTRRDSRMAAGVQYFVAQSHGLALGLAGGLVLAGFLIPNAIPDPLSDIGAWAGATAIGIVVILACGALTALIGAAIVGAFAPATAPLAKLETAA